MHRKRTLTLAALAGLTMTLSLADVMEAEAAPTKVVSLEGITEYELDNGLKVLLFPDASKPQVTVNLTILVGSRHEGYGETGMAHLLEHMLFKGTPDHPDIIGALQERGANFNGTTWVDRTNYYETLKATDENLEFAIRLEADRMVNSYVKREDLLSEMTVVRNEFEQGENNPVDILNQRMTAVAYEWHNYGKSTIGNRSDIERVPIENLQAFYRKHYQPDNAILVVAGRFEEAKALELIDKYFGAIPRPERKLPKTYTEEPAQDGERRVVLRRVGDVAVASAMYHIPAGSHPDFAPLQVLDEILTGEPAGRLYKALVETQKAAAVGGLCFGWHDPGVYQVLALVRDASRLHNVLDELIQVTEVVGAEGVAADEVERAKQRILSLRELHAADTTQVAIQFSQWAAQGDWRLYLLHRDRVEAVTADDVQRVAAAYLRPNNRTVGLFEPTDAPERIDVPVVADLAAVIGDYQGRDTVAAGEVFDPSIENIESRVVRETLHGGFKVALLAKKTRGETVDLRLTLRYGDAENLKGLETACDFLPSLMARGTRDLDYQTLKAELDKNRAVLGTAGDLGSATFTLATKREFLPTVLELLRRVIREPALAAAELAILKQEQLASLEQTKSDPQGLAPNHVRRILSPYPAGDVRYVPTIEESIDRTANLELSQVERVFGFLRSDAGELAVVGDFEPGEVVKWAESALGGLEPSAEYKRIEYHAFDNVAAGQTTINTPDKANALYYAGQVFPMRDDNPDYPALILGNEVFGGSPSARLFVKIRQQQGLSYGVYSGISARALDPRASLTVMGISNPDNAEKMAASIREVLDTLLADGIPAEELDEMRQGYLQQQEIQRAEDSQLCSMLSAASYAGRTLEFDAKQEERIRALQPEEVVAALRKYILPDQLVIALAGDFEKDGAK